MAEENARFLPFVAVKKRLEAKLHQFFAVFDIVIGITHRYDAYK